MRVLLIAILGFVLLFLVRQEAWNWLTLSRFDPVLAGYAALFGAGIVVAELLRPLLSILSSPVRFVVVVLIAAFGWAAADYVLRPAGDVPFQPRPIGGNDPNVDMAQATLTRAWDGRFRDVGEVNGLSAAMTIDTGAAFVTLPRNEAQRLGLLAGAKFDAEVVTDQGRVRAAHVRLRSVRIGDVGLTGVDAIILDRDAPPTVAIGLSFLTRLSDLSINGDSMVLRAPAR